MFWGRFGGIWGSEGVPLGWRPQTPFLGPNRDFQVFWGGEHLIWVRRDPGRLGASLGRPGVAWTGLGQARGGLGGSGAGLGQAWAGPGAGPWGTPKGGSLGSKRGVFGVQKGGLLGPKRGVFWGSGAGLGQAWAGPGGTPGGPLLAGSQGRTHASASLWPKPPFVTSGYY